MKTGLGGEPVFLLNTLAIWIYMHGLPKVDPCKPTSHRYSIQSSRVNNDCVPTLHFRPHLITNDRIAQPSSNADPLSFVAPAPTMPSSALQIFYTITTTVSSKVPASTQAAAHAMLNQTLPRSCARPPRPRPRNASLLLIELFAP